MPTRSVSAVILAAGMSTRLETALASVSGSQAGEIIVVLGASAEEIRRKIALDSFKVVVDENSREGMGASLRRGIAEVTGDAALVVLADRPPVQPTTLDALIAAYREKTPQVAIPVYRGFRGNPVLLDRGVFPELNELSADPGCRAIFGGHTQNILKVPVDDPCILLDADTHPDSEHLRPAAAPRPEIVIVGSEKSGKTLAALAHLMNFSVTIMDPFLTADDVPGAERLLQALDFSSISPHAYVVIASGGRFDEEAVEQALSIGANYIALIANKKRAREVLDRVNASPQDLARVRTKAGIDIHAQGPQEVALSIMAEIVAERHRTR